MSDHCYIVIAVLSITVLALAYLLHVAQKGWSKAIEIAEGEMARADRYRAEMKARGIW